MHFESISWTGWNKSRFDRYLICTGQGCIIRYNTIVLYTLPALGTIVGPPRLTGSTGSTIVPVGSYRYSTIVLLGSQQGSYF